MGQKREAGMSIGKGRVQGKFDYEIRFRKDAGLFFAVVPPGDTLQSDSLQGIKKEIHAYAENYQLPGAWVKKIHIVSDIHTRGGWTNGFDIESAGLSISWFVFEEREVSPKGQRIARKFEANPRPEHEHMRHRRGSDEEHLLSEGHVVLWTQEREDMLVTLREALNALHAKLEGLLKTPELLADVMKMLPPPADLEEEG